MRKSTIRWAVAALLLFTALSVHAIVLPNKYPNYAYVLKEFDIDQGYIANPQFEHFVQKNEARFQRFYCNSAKRGKEYMPMFQNLLVKDGLSQLFVYLSMTESGFKVNAKSNKSAAGLWQFMSATAQRFNLKVNKHVDQRYDPIASTEAAMKYIHTLYRQFGKWYLVMMAYNCGEGRLGRAITRAGTDNFATLMDDKAKHIPAETRTYLKKIILLSMMGEDIVKGTSKEKKEIKLKIIDGKVLVNVVGGTNLMELATEIQVTLPDLFDMNPHLRDYRVPEEIWMVQIKIPVEKYLLFHASYRPPTLQGIFKKKHYSRLITHIVRKGDTLKSIARKYRTTPIDIIVTNSLGNKKLVENSLLSIPVTEELFESKAYR